MASELEMWQIVSVVQERGTRRRAIVRGTARDGQVIVSYEDGEFDTVDREDIET